MEPAGRRLSHGKYTCENAPQSRRGRETRERYFNDFGWNA